MDSISRKPGQAATSNFFDSHRPTHVATHERLETSLTITSTTVGRTVKLKTASLDPNLPHGPSNAADQFLRHTQSLFENMGSSPSHNRRAAHHYVNMVSIRTLPEDKSGSTNSSIGFVSTEVLHPEDEDYDLDLPPYPPGFSHFPVFPPRRADLVLNVSNDKQVVEGETDEQRQQREQRNADGAQRRADEERQLAPNNLGDAFDMVGNQ